MPRKKKASALDNEEMRHAVKGFVQATGTLTDAWLLTTYKHASSFFAYLEQHPDFHAELKHIKTQSDPTRRADLIQKAMDAVEQNLTHGSFKKLSLVNAETGKLELKSVTQTGASKWAVELMLNRQSVTEAALNMIVATQFKKLAGKKSITDEIKRVIFAFLQEFRRDELIELIKQGKRVSEEPE